MNLADKILRDVGDLAKYKAIRPFDLKELGYRFSTRKIILKSTHYTLFEVLDEDGRWAASFCFLFCKETGTGIVLSRDFDKYYTEAIEEIKLERRKIKRKRPGNKPGPDGNK